MQSSRVRLLALLGVLVLATTGGPAWAQEIGVSWDPQGLVCERSIAPGTEGTFYIFAHLAGPLAGGATGAEFRLVGFPSDWDVLAVTPHPDATVVIGNPLAGGCDIAFANCQTGTANIVVLFTVRFFAPTLVTERVLAIRPHSTPTNPDFVCPRMFPCDFCYCLICTGAGTAAINFPGYCAVAVEPRSWTSVRSLFR